MHSQKTFYLRVTLGDKVYKYNILNEKIEDIVSVNDYSDHIIHTNISSLENFKRDNEIYDNYSSKFHQSIVSKLENDKETIERTMRLSFGNIKKIMDRAYCFSMLPGLYEEINNAYSEFYKYINRSFEVLERNRLDSIKFIDSGICDLIDNAELLKEGDYEKYIYERLAKVQKEGKKVSISPDDIDLLLGYIEKKRQKGRS